MMIEVKNLFFSYGKRKQKVFDDFSLALDKGSVYGLLGKNAMLAEREKMQTMFNK